MDEKNQSKLKRKLRIAVFVDNSYEQLFSLRLSPINVFTFVGCCVIIFTILVSVLIAFTSLREYIPGYPTGEERHQIMENLQRTDSLIFELKLRDAMVSNLRAVISGELPEEAWNQDSLTPSSTAALTNVLFQRSEADSIFRKQVEAEDSYNVHDEKSNSDPRIEMMYLYPPMKGIVTGQFGSRFGHYGVDVACAEGTRVSSILDGTVIFAEWTVETGYVIQVQHDNQLVSIYKHNSKLLKEVGMHVNGGEAIAIIGNSGEFTTGTHLHFEIWHAGVPLNPENYISFD